MQPRYPVSCRWQMCRPAVRVSWSASRDRARRAGASRIWACCRTRTSAWSDALRSAIHDKLFTLPDDTIVLPGHGPETTIGEEKQTNPFVGAPAGYKLN